MKHTESMTIEDPQKKIRNKNQDEIPQILERRRFHGTCRGVIKDWYSGIILKAL